MNFKTGLIATLLPLCGFSMTLDDRVSELEKKMAMTSTITEMGNRGANNATAYPENLSNGWHAEAGFLYLHPNVQGNAFASKDNLQLTSLSSSNNTLRHDVITQDFGWNWGLVIGAGYIIPNYNWDIALDYTYFTDSSTTKTSAGLNGVISPIRSYPSLADFEPFDNCSSASSNFKISHNSLDLTAGSSLFTNRYFSLQFLTGLRSHWLDLTQKIYYLGGEQLGTNDWKVSASSKFWGMGPLAGFNTRWWIVKDFSLFSNLTLSYLYGRFEVTDNQSNAENGYFDYATSNLHQGVNELDALLGLSWGRYFNDHNQYINISLAYQYNYYWSVNQMIRRTPTDFAVYASTNMNGDMNMMGIVGWIRFDF
ncbi:MAG: hypothetical protein K9M07_02700 [Simkaniaceae bacterium]|nr:hypothetical protein [Simkaniaceae bacterium]